MQPESASSARPGAGGGVLGLGVDPRPDRIELAEPREEVGLLRAGSREGLVEVVVRVDEPGRDDRAAQVDALVGLGLGSAADRRDHAVLDEQPAGLVLRPGVVAGGDPTGRVQNGHAVADTVSDTASGTSSKRSTSTSPRSVIFRCGMTESARNASVRNGVAPVQPRLVCRLVAGAALRDDLGERRIREQPGDRQRALGENAQSVDGDDPASELGESLDGERHVPIGHADDDEVVRVVRDARRERAALQPRPGDEAEPDPARREVALDDGDLREVVLRRSRPPGRLRRRARAPSDSVTT